MALIKEKETQFGIKADYWRIDTITIDKRMREANFVLGLYLNKEASESFESKAVIIADREDKGELFDKHFAGKGYTDIYNSCYECVKEIDDFFADAKDDAEEIALINKEGK